VAQPDEQAKEKLPRDANEEPFKFLVEDHEELDNCWKFYGISDKFPRTMLVRNATGEPVRTIYYVAPSVKPIIALNDGRIKFVHAGIKMFAQQKNEGACKWRIQSEGIEAVFPYVDDKRVLRASSLETLKVLCQTSFPRWDDLEKFDVGLKEQAEKIDEGCAFLVVPREETKGGDIVFPMWRGRASVNIMLPKQDVQEVLLRLFGLEPTKEKQHAAPSGTTTDKTDDAKTEVEGDSELEPKAQDTE
jgi:multisite-specific tRNA:(cytosine-C5)-methyltransferase